MWGFNSDSYNQARGVEIIAHARRCWVVHNAVGRASGVPRLTLFNYLKHHRYSLLLDQMRRMCTVHKVYREYRIQK